MSKLDWLDGEIAELRARGLLRSQEILTEGELIDVCSNDYLGYAAAGVSRETILDLRGGAGASRLVSGTLPVHERLESEVADWLGHEAALLFSSGYVANLSTIAALMGPGDAIFSDRLNHASIIDGCRLSGATVHVYPHLDLTALSQMLGGNRGNRRALVVSESYFSMDGDTPDLPELARICSRSGAMLMLDEAHALGVHGPNGAGRAREAGVQPDVLVGTLGKALGTQGAFVCGSRALRQWLWNRARGFVFSTALSPVVASIALHNVRRARADQPAREHLLQLCSAFAQDRTLSGAGIGPIFPIILDSSERAIEVSTQLRAAGFHAPPIRPPTVPDGSSRLRVTLNARLALPTVHRLAAEILTACA